MKGVRGLPNTHSARFGTKDTHLPAHLMPESELTALPGVDCLRLDVFRPLRVEMVDTLVEILSAVAIICDAYMVPAG